MRRHRLRVKVGTWNVAAKPGTDKDLAAWFVEGKGVDPRFDAGLAMRMRRRGNGEALALGLGGPKRCEVVEAKEVRDADERDKAGGASERTEEVDARDGGNDEGQVRVLGDNDDEIGLYVLGLQEVVDLNTVGEYMSRLYVETAANVDKWTSALEAALPPGYQRIVAEQQFGNVLLVYASPKVAKTITQASTSSVGTGLLGGWFGNKGALSARLVLGETARLVLTHCHLASGVEQAYLDRRVQDIQTILSNTRFEPLPQFMSTPLEDTEESKGDGDSEGSEPKKGDENNGQKQQQGQLQQPRHEKIGDEDFAFWFGDLNFRLDGVPGEDIRRILMLHTRGEYGDGLSGQANGSLDGEGEGVVVRRESEIEEEISTSQSPTISDDTLYGETVDLPDPDEFLPDPHDDPLSLQSTLDSLLSHDQLQRLMKERKAFHDGWREGPITFLPSYKYDVGTVSLFDSSEKQRPPSWCDRILFRTRKDKLAFDKKVKEEEAARRKDEDMKARGIDEAGDEESVLFDYDPEADAIDEPQTPGFMPGAYGFDYDEDGANTQDAVEREELLDNLACDIYTSHQRIISSDHKPVVGLFTLDYDAVVPELKARVHAEVARELDRAENESRPGITIVADSLPYDAGASVDPQTGEESVDFGDVKFLTPKTALLTIANTGRVPATFSFVDKPTTDVAESYSLYRWLTADFVAAGSAAESDDEEESGKDATMPPDPRTHVLGKEITLYPGETVCARLRVYVDDPTHVRALNDGHSHLEDVLVLRVTEGRDHFIPVRASWLPTCFGRSIEELIRVPDGAGGVRGFCLQRIQEAEEQGREFEGGSIPYKLPVHNSAPKELFKLTEAVEALTERVLAEESILSAPDTPPDGQAPRQQRNQHSVPRDKPGWPFDPASWQLPADSRLRQRLRSQLVDALDTDCPLLTARVFPADVPAPYRLEVAAETLLLWLRALTDGVVSAPLWARIEASPSVGPMLGTRLGNEDDKAAVLDALSAAPNHNIAFVFLASMLCKVAAELAPIPRKALDSLVIQPSNGATRGRAVSMGSRVSLSSFGRLASSVTVGRARAGTTGSGTGRAIGEAIARRSAVERRFAEIFGTVICRASMPVRDRDRRLVEDRMRGIVEMFVHRVEVDE